MVSSMPRLHFIPGKDTVPILQEARWVPGLVWTGGKFRPHRNFIKWYMVLGFPCNMSSQAATFVYTEIKKIITLFNLIFHWAFLQCSVTSQ